MPEVTRAGSRAHSIRFPDEMWEQIKAAAAAEERTTQVVIRRAVRAYLREHHSTG